MAFGLCGSDLHLYDGYMPTMESGDVLGNEFMGEVIEFGSAIMNLNKGDRVVVPFTMACGSCFFCQKQLFSCCDNSNPNAKVAEEAMGHSPSGLFGYSHMLCGFAGGQAEYVRVPFADVGPYKVPENLPDEKVLFLTDILPTGYMAAEQATSNRARRSPCGVAVPSGNSPSRVHGSLGPGGWSPLTACPSDWRWRAGSAVPK